MRIACLLVLALALAACSEDADPIAGLWVVHRTAHPAPAGCDALADLPDLVIQVSPGVTPPVTQPDCDQCLMDWGRSVEANEVKFISGEYPFDIQSPNSGDEVLIGHDLHLVGDQLHGTAAAGGDGANIGCSWSVDVVATRATSATP